MAAWDQFNLQNDPPRITIDGNLAIARQTYRLRVIRQGKELSLSGETELKLRKENNDWKIIGGL